MVRALALELAADGVTANAVLPGMVETEKVAASIADKSLVALFAAKAALDAALETSLAEGLRFERHAFSALFDTEDQKEGMAAFREKRPPAFRNR